MKAVSVGLVLTDGERLLICHSTGNAFYDLPKGSPESGESARQTCVREVREETGLDVSEKEMFDLGVFPYNKRKNLRLFALISDELPDTGSMSCSTYFTDVRGEGLPEVDGYRYISFSETEAFMTANMARTVAMAEKWLRKRFLRTKNA